MTALAPGAEVEAATWPPARVVDVDGWRVGLSGGLTRRANSVLPLAAPADLRTTLDRVEALYAEAGQPSIVRVDSAAPPGLADLLATRGYAEVSRTAVLVRDIGPFEHLPLPGITVADGPDDAWLALWSGSKARLHVSGTAEDDDGASLRLARTVLGGAPALYLTAGDDSGPVGVIRAAFARDWVALSCLVVAPGARRRGLGRALTVQSLDAAARRGARRAFLQVEDRSEAAIALYAGLGFAEADRYAYWELGA